MSYRQSEARITVKIDGVDLGIFEDRTGGEGDSAETRYALGGMGGEISLGGRQTLTNVVLTCLYDTARQARLHWLYGRCGKGRVVITEQPLDDEENVSGDPIVWTGTLKRVKPPDRSAGSDAAATLELEVTTTGDIG